MSRFGPRLFGTAPVSSWLSSRASGIKTIQRGVIAIAGATTNTATITAVDPANSLLVYGGTDDTAGTEWSTGTARLTFTNATTITATRVSADVATCSVNFEVIEYYPGVLRRVQRGTITNSLTSVDATITSVDVLKSSVAFLGFALNSATTETALRPRVRLVNATTVRSEVATASNQVVAYQVAEFF